jgi:hypothetical protein
MRFAGAQRKRKPSCTRERTGPAIKISAMRMTAANFRIGRLVQERRRTKPSEATAKKLRKKASLR